MRVSDALRIIQDQLGNYESLENVDVEIENLVDHNGPVNHSGVIISLLKVEEEFSLKNGKHFKLTESYQVTFKNRKVYTNFYILISCHEVYLTALANLSMVIEFFQGKNIFTHLDGLPDGVDLDENFKLIVELEDFTFEQMNYIWGLFGGLHRPSVIYKVRLIPHEARNKKNNVGEPILKVKLEGSSTL